MTSLRIESVNTARSSVLLHWPTGDVLSAIDKRAVAVPTLELSPLGLEGDEQADTRNTPAGDQVHGGPHQAVYAFPLQHYERLEQIVGSPLWPGYMGENLTIGEVREDDVAIGDVWAWGTAVLEVSAPRGPCYKLGIRMGKQGLRAAVREEGLVGWYLRVLSPGQVPAKGTIEVIERDQRGVTVAAVHRALQARHQTFPEIAEHPALSPKIRAALLVRDRDLTGGVPEQD